MKTWRVSQAGFDRLSAATDRRTRIALMGEFSAGKSTLLNLLMAREVATTQVTATHVPAVWLRRGTSDVQMLFDYAGNIKGQVGQTDVEPTPDTCAMVRVEMDDSTLDRFDLIDTPGISDPLMEQSALRVIAGYSDFVIWCTTAVQAWRQSELATWEQLPERLRAQSILVVTGIDRLSEKDGKRVIKRVKREAGKLFRTILPLSSLQAAKALDIEEPTAAAEAWRSSGGEALIEEIGHSVEAKDAERAQLLDRYTVVTPTPETPTSETHAADLEQQQTDGPIRVDEEIQQSADAKREEKMSTDISGLKKITAFIGGCLVDSDTGLMLGSEGGNGQLDLEVAAAANTEVVKAKLAAMEALQLDDKIEDILITLGSQYHLIRPMEQSPTVFLYVALDKATANLGMARLQVKKVEQTLSL